MLEYTEEGRKAVIDALREAEMWGAYGAEFRNALHTKLSYMHLREDKIFLRGGTFKSTPDHPNKTVNFSCEFDLKWERGIYGGLVWSEFSKTFGLHS